MAKRQTEKLTACGYEALVQQYSLKVLPHYRRSFVSSLSRRETILEDGRETHIYPKRYLPSNPENPFAQLEFAWRHEGVNLEILHALFHILEPNAVTAFIRSQPTGHFSRRIWYLYEFLTGNRLDIPDFKKGSYTLLIDPEKYYTGPIRRSTRHHLDDNLIGTESFCPVVRRTELLGSFEQKQLEKVAKGLIEQYDPLIIGRAMRYLYTKETMSSFEIEREWPNRQRSLRFVELLKATERESQVSKEYLIKLQNLIVDPRFAETDYRDFQNYVGEEPLPHELILHYIAAKPEDVASLMQGLVQTLSKLSDADIHPIIVAAIIAFGFVFIHPFEDGNGRLHRFLIHHILVHSGFVPSGSIFPVSATMLRDMKTYDQALESYSKPLMECLEERFIVKRNGEVEVSDQTAAHYRYIDFTSVAEYLFSCVERTIDTEFRAELEFIANYDRAKSEIQEIVDMPDRKIDLIIKFVRQNHGKLSSKKQERYFQMLTREEVEQIEEVIQGAFDL